MTITVGIDEKIHMMIQNRQQDIYGRTGVRLKLGDIASEAILNGLDQVDSSCLKFKELGGVVNHE